MSSQMNTKGKLRFYVIFVLRMHYFTKTLVNLINMNIVNESKIPKLETVKFIAVCFSQVSSVKIKKKADFFLFVSVKIYNKAT